MRRERAPTALFLTAVLLGPVASAALAPEMAILIEDENLPYAPTEFAFVGTVKLNFTTTTNLDPAEPRFTVLTLLVDHPDALRLTSGGVSSVVGRLYPELTNKFVFRLDPGSHVFELASHGRFTVALEQQNFPQVRFTLDELPGALTADLFPRYGAFPLELPNFLEVQVDAPFKSRYVVSGVVAANRAEALAQSLVDVLAQGVVQPPLPPTPPDPAGLAPLPGEEPETWAGRVLGAVGAYSGEVASYAEAAPGNALVGGLANVATEGASELRRDVERAVNATLRDGQLPASGVRYLAFDDDILREAGFLPFGLFRLEVRQSYVYDAKLVLAHNGTAAVQMGIADLGDPFTVGGLLDRTSATARGALGFVDAVLGHDPELLGTTADLPSLAELNERAQELGLPPLPVPTTLRGNGELAEALLEEAYRAAATQAAPHLDLLDFREAARAIRLDPSAGASVYEFARAQLLDPGQALAECQDPLHIFPGPVMERCVDVHDGVLAAIDAHLSVPLPRTLPVGGELGPLPGEPSVWRVFHADAERLQPPVFPPPEGAPPEALAAFVAKYLVADLGAPLAVPVGAAAGAEGGPPDPTIVDGLLALVQSADANHVRAWSVFVPKDVYVVWGDAAEVLSPEAGELPVDADIPSQRALYNLVYPQLLAAVRAALPDYPAVGLQVPVMLLMTGTSMVAGVEGAGVRATGFRDSTRVLSLRWENRLDPDLDGAESVQELNQTGLLQALPPLGGPVLGVLRTNTTGSDPHNPDTDEDGIADGWEQFWWLRRGKAAGIHPLDHADGALDVDGDGLSNWLEFQFNVARLSDDDGFAMHRVGHLVAEAARHTPESPRVLDPTDPDTDRDGLPDGYELAYRFLMGCQPRAGVDDRCLDPLDPRDATVDFDLDGLTTLEEYQHPRTSAVPGSVRGPDPFKADTDGDGIPDGWEVWNGLDPTDPADADCTEADEGVLGVRCAAGQVVELPFGKALQAYAPTGRLAVLDPDGDLLTNKGEYLLSSTYHAADLLVYGPRFLKTAGLSAQVRDGDADGMWDGWERLQQVRSGCAIVEGPGVGCINPFLPGDTTLDHDAPPWTSDPIGDGLGALDEFLAATDPFSGDTDGDGISDAWETWHALDPLDPSDARCTPGSTEGAATCHGSGAFLVPALGAALPGPRPFDPDGDLATNFGEYRHSLAFLAPEVAAKGEAALRVSGLDPHGGDADADGMLDGWELAYRFAQGCSGAQGPDEGCLSPLSPGDAGQDADADGLLNVEEHDLALHPLDGDSDDDGMPDSWEVWRGLRPLDGGDSACVPGETRTVGIVVRCSADRVLWEPQSGPDVRAYDPDDHVRATDPDADLATNYGEYAFSFNYYAGIIAQAGLSVLRKEGLKPLVRDTDGDELWDGYEIWLGFDPFKEDPLDPDGDGLTNAEELALGTHPRDPDTDGDDMPDGWELWQGLDPSDASDAALDSDGDGLTNLQEWRYSFARHARQYLADPTVFKPPPGGAGLGLSPHDPDSDGDGMWDGWEAYYGLDALAPSSEEDADGDGLTDGEEFALVKFDLETLVAEGHRGLALFLALRARGQELDPTHEDTDRDGMWDSWESWHFLNPRSAADGPQDADSDGLTNREEFKESLRRLGSIARLRVEGLQPFRQDTDTDGMWDGWEVYYGLDPLARLDTNDQDGDGLTDPEEFDLVFDILQDLAEAGLRGPALLQGLIRSGRALDPSDADTDGDGMWDGFELWHGLNPVDHRDGDEDADEDSLPNRDEFLYNIERFDRLVIENPRYLHPQAGKAYLTPLLADSDDDDVADLDELQLRDRQGCGILGTPADGCFDPLSPLDMVETADFDHDGLSNPLELRRGWDIEVVKRKPCSGKHAYRCLKETTHAFSDPLSGDSDGDGLRDGEEFNLKSHPLHWDTDNDRITDLVEERQLLEVANITRDADGDGFPNLRDMDSDGDSYYSEIEERNKQATPKGYIGIDLTDGREIYLFGTSPWKRDTDGDWADDGREIAYMVSKGKQIWGHLRDPDVDKDGIPDGWEIAYNTDPFDAQDMELDTDGDGIKSRDEFRKSAEAAPGHAGWGIAYNSSADELDDGLPCYQGLVGCSLGANLRDSDGDGMPDGWEDARGLNPTNGDDRDLRTLFGDCSNINVYLYGHPKCTEAGQDNAVPPAFYDGPIIPGLLPKGVPADAPPIDINLTRHVDIVCQERVGCVDVDRFVARVRFSVYDWQTAEGLAAGLSHLDIAISGNTAEGPAKHKVRLELPRQAFATVTHTFELPALVFNVALDAAVYNTNGLHSEVRFEQELPNAAGTADDTGAAWVHDKIVSWGSAAVGVLVRAKDDIVNRATQVIAAGVKIVFQAGEMVFDAIKQAADWVVKKIEAAVSAFISFIVSLFQGYHQGTYDEEAAFFKALRDAGDGGIDRAEARAVKDAGGRLLDQMAGIKGIKDLIMPVITTVKWFYEVVQAIVGGGEGPNKDEPLGFRGAMMKGVNGRIGRAEVINGADSLGKAVAVDTAGYVLTAGIAWLSDMVKKFLDTWDGFRARHADSEPVKLLKIYATYILAYAIIALPSDDGFAGITQPRGGDKLAILSHQIHAELYAILLPVLGALGMAAGLFPGTSGWKLGTMASMMGALLGLYVGVTQAKFKYALIVASIGFGIALAAHAVGALRHLNLLGGLNPYVNQNFIRNNYVYETWDEHRFHYVRGTGFLALHTGIQWATQEWRERLRYDGHTYVDLEMDTQPPFQVPETPLNLPGKVEDLYGLAQKAACGANAAKCGVEAVKALDGEKPTERTGTEEPVATGKTMALQEAEDKALEGVKVTAKKFVVTGKYLWHKALREMRKFFGLAILGPIESFDLPSWLGPALDQPFQKSVFVSPRWSTT